MSISSEKDAKRLLSLTIKIAKLMLSCGAEIYRVEDTINRIYKAFDNIKSINVLVTYSFIIVTFSYDGINYTTMRRIEIGEKNLEKISLVNDLSRKIVANTITMKEAFVKLKEIKTKKSYPAWLTILALGVSSPFFAYLFGGTLKDAVPAFLVMVFVASFLVLTTRFRLMEFLNNFLGTFLGTILVSILSKIIVIHNPTSIIIAIMMPLVPGVKVTNCVRDFLAGDYMSGVMGMISAVFISIAIALGVIFGLRIFL